MKRVFIILLGIFALGLGQAQAQINPDYLSMKKGKFYDENGRVLTDGQMRQIIGNQIFEETYRGATKQFKAGKSLITWGAVGLGVGAAASVACTVLYEDSYDDALIAGVYGGYALAALGAVALEAGIPLKIIGRSRLNWIADNYNESKTISLHMTGCPVAPGLGLALVF